MEKILRWLVIIIIIIIILYLIWVFYLSERPELKRILFNIGTPIATLGIAGASSPAVAASLVPQISHTFDSIGKNTGIVPKKDTKQIDGTILATNINVIGNDINCYKDGSSGSFCVDKCKQDPECKSAIEVHPGGIWGENTSGCCYKSKAAPIEVYSNVDLYVLSHE